MAAPSVVVVLMSSVDMLSSVWWWDALGRVLGLGVEVAAERRSLGPTLVSGLLHDRGDVRVGDEALPAFLVPVEDHPDPVVFVGVAKDVRTLRPVLLPLLGALRGEDLHEAVVILERRRL